MTAAAARAGPGTGTTRLLASQSRMFWLEWSYGELLDLRSEEPAERPARRGAEGASVTITDRGRPVARLEPVLAGEEDQLLAALVRRGLVVRPRGETGDLRRLRPVRTRQTAALVDAVVAERREGR